MATLERWQTEGTVEQLPEYPDWAIIDHADGSGWQVLRRGNVGDPNDWGCYDRHPSRADAYGFIQETLDFERRAARIEARRQARQEK